MLRLEHALLAREQLQQLVEVDVAVGIEISAPQQPRELLLGVRVSIGQRELLYNEAKGAGRERPAPVVVVPPEGGGRALDISRAQAFGVEVAQQALKSIEPALPRSRGHDAHVLLKVDRA